MDSNSLSLNACKNIKIDTLDERMEHNLETGQHLMQKIYISSQIVLENQNFDKEKIISKFIVYPYRVFDFRN